MGIVCFKMLAKICKYYFKLNQIKMSIGIFYGSSTGNAEGAAKNIQKQFGSDIASVYDTSKASQSDIEKHDFLILGSSTWGLGELQDDFDVFLSVLRQTDLTGKKVAIFGLGDQECYPDTFANSIGWIADAVKDKGCKLVGKVSSLGYSSTGTKAFDGNQFYGLPLDEDNQPELTNERIINWVNELKES
jgi:flavodoxin I